MKFDHLRHCLVATIFMGSSLPTTAAASTAAHTSFDRGLRGGTTYTPHKPHTPRDLQREPPSESVTCAGGIYVVEVEHGNNRDSIGNDGDSYSDSYISCETSSGKSYKINGLSDSVESEIRASIIGIVPGIADTMPELRLPEGSVVNESTATIDLPAGLSPTLEWGTMALPTMGPQTMRVADDGVADDGVEYDGVADDGVADDGVEYDGVADDGADRRNEPPSESVTCAVGIYIVEVEHGNNRDSIGNDGDSYSDSYISCEMSCGKSYKINGLSDSVESEIRTSMIGIVSGIASTMPELRLPEGSVVNESTATIDLPAGLSPTLVWGTMALPTMGSQTMRVAEDGVAYDGADRHRRQ